MHLHYGVVTVFPDAAESLPLRVQFRLRGIVFECWELPPVVGNSLLRLLLFAEAQRAREVRYHLRTTADEGLAVLFRHVLTPQFMMALLRDLCAMGALQIADSGVIEEALLRQTCADGHWRT